MNDLRRRSWGFVEVVCVTSICSASIAEAACWSIDEREGTVNSLEVKYREVFESNRSKGERLCR
jgi:hypothetical protein